VIYELLTELGERLSLVLDQEFEALAQKNLPLLESLQSQKVELLSEIESSWKGSPEPDKDDSSFGEIRALIETCREKHIRNDILLRKQIDEVQALIGTLTSQTSGNYGNVYNKLGKIKK
jgi:flagellar biosynthesis/type III secretory pathway chaperone